MTVPSTTEPTQITITPWPRANHDEIAHLTGLARDPTATPGQQAIDAIARELDALLSSLPRYAVLARECGELTGWVLLVVQDATRVALNPWDLGGHPLVLPGHDCRAVGAGLLRAAAARARDGDYEVLEVSFSRDTDPAVCEAHRAWYASLGFHLREESVGFFRRLDGEEPAAVALPEGVELRPVGEVDTEALYTCYHETFSASRSGTFLDQSERERRAFFDTFGRTWDLHEPTSVAMVRAGEVVGFAYTIPFGAYLHVDWIGVRPGARRRGLGRFLMQWIMVRAARAGFQTMGLSCDRRNKPAVGLYRSLGWRPTDGEIKLALRL